jgi:hypothetical protein
VNPESLPLKDIHLPAAVGWWPPAPGWWLLAVVVAVTGWWLWRRARRVPPGPELRHVAARELAAIRADWEVHGDARRLAAELSVLMRRVALADTASESVAGLTGQAWLAHLDSRVGAALFTDGAGRVLLDAPYRPAAQVDAEGLLDACLRFVEAPARDEADQGVGLAATGTRAQDGPATGPDETDARESAA